MTQAGQLHDTIVIGASAGGVSALTSLAADLPADLPAAVLVVLHVSPTGASVLPDILSRHGQLPAAHAVDGEPLAPGRITIAPPDHHLLVDGDVLRVTQGPRENGHRPAVDPLFRTAASTRGPRVIGVVLSGALDDGAAGLKLVREHGGVGVVQDPAEAATPGMPANAIRVASPDHVVPIEKLGSLLVDLVRGGGGGGGSKPPTQQPGGGSGDRKGILAGSADVAGELVEAGEVSDFTCPDCGGTLFHRGDYTVDQFRCRVGHAFTIESLYGTTREALEGALWTAVRALVERGALARRIAGRLDDRGMADAAARFLAEAEDHDRRAELVRRAAEGRLGGTDEEPRSGHGGGGRRAAP